MKRTGIRELAGIVTEEEGEELKRIITKNRKRWNSEFEKGQRELFGSKTVKKKSAVSQSSRLKVYSNTRTHILHMVKTLTVTDEAYSLLAAQKREGESFSKVITRTSRRATLRDLVGLLTPVEAAGVRKAVSDSRKRMRVGFNETTKRLQ